MNETNSQMMTPTNSKIENPQMTTSKSKCSKKKIIFCIVTGIVIILLASFLIIYFFVINKDKDKDKDGDKQTSGNDNKIPSETTIPTIEQTNPLSDTTSSDFLFLKMTVNVKNAK